jgi:archaellin
MIDFTPPTAGNYTNKVVISYSDAYQMVPSLNWTLTKLNTAKADNILENNDLFLITVDLTSISANVTDDKKPRPYHKFSLQIMPPVGAVLVLERTIPARVDEIVNLY